MLVSGKSGVGKTYTCLEWPNLFYIDTEKGATEPEYTQRMKDAGVLYMGPGDGTLDPVQLVESFWQLHVADHDRKTVTVDSITKAFNVWTVEAEKRVGSAFGADKKEAIKWMRRLIANMDQLDMNVILIAHSKPEWSDGECIGETFDCWDKLEYELDLWVEVKRQGSKRIAIVRKSRIAAFPVGDRFPWTYETFADLYGRDNIEAKRKKENHNAVLTRLIKKHDIDKEIVQRWLDAANVESTAKMTSEQQRGCIDWINDNVVSVG